MIVFLFAIIGVISIIYVVDVIRNLHAIQIDLDKKESQESKEIEVPINTIAAKLIEHDKRFDEHDEKLDKILKEIRNIVAELGVRHSTLNE